MKENADKARALDTAELNKQVSEAAEQMFRLRFQMSMGQADGLKKLRSLRKERARMLTVLRERQDGAMPGATPGAAPVVAHKSAKVQRKAAATAEAAPKKAAAASKPKAAGAPKSHRNAGQVKVKQTMAPKPKISTPRKAV